jgi:hypothetical protein
MPPETVPEGAAALHHAFEPLYAQVPVNQQFPSTLQMRGEGEATICFEVDKSHFHAAGAVQGKRTFMRSQFALSTLPSYTR